MTEAFWSHAVEICNEDKRYGERGMRCKTETNNKFKTLSCHCLLGEIVEQASLLYFGETNEMHKDEAHLSADFSSKIHYRLSIDCELKVRFLCSLINNKISTKTSHPSMDCCFNAECLCANKRNLMVAGGVQKETTWLGRLTAVILIGNWCNLTSRELLKLSVAKQCRDSGVVHKETESFRPPVSGLSSNRSPPALKCQKALTSISWMNRGQSHHWFLHWIHAETPVTIWAECRIFGQHSTSAK